MRRIDRKGLPDRHAGRDQVLHKTVGRRPKISVMKPPRKRRNVKEKSRTTAVENAVRVRHV